MAEIRLTGSTIQVLDHHRYGEGITLAIGDDRITHLREDQLTSIVAGAISSGILNLEALHRLRTITIPAALLRYDEGDGTYYYDGQAWRIQPTGRAPMEVGS